MTKETERPSELFHRYARMSMSEFARTPGGIVVLDCEDLPPTGMVRLVQSYSARYGGYIRAIGYHGIPKQSASDRPAPCHSFLRLEVVTPAEPRKRRGREPKRAPK